MQIFAHCAWDGSNAQPYATRFYLGLLNNVLLQVVGTSKQVWLPCLTNAPYLSGAVEHLALIEYANIALSMELSYEVHLVRANFPPFWQWMGGLRCLTNDLARSVDLPLNTPSQTTPVAHWASR